MQTAHGSSIKEHCSECGKETPHSVNVELIVEGADQKNSAYSREPYRNTTCQECGFGNSERMNSA